MLCRNYFDDGDTPTAESRAKPQRKIVEPPYVDYSETNYFIYDATESNLIVTMTCGLTPAAPQEKQYTLISEDGGKPIKTTKIGAAAKEVEDKYRQIRSTLMTQ